MAHHPRGICPPGSGAAPAVARIRGNRRVGCSPAIRRRGCLRAAPGCRGRRRRRRRPRPGARFGSNLGGRRRFRVGRPRPRALALLAGDPYDGRRRRRGRGGRWRGMKPVAVPVAVLVPIAVGRRDRRGSREVDAFLVADLIPVRIVRPRLGLIPVAREVRGSHRNRRRAERQRPHDGRAADKGSDLGGECCGKESDHRACLRDGGGPLPGRAPFLLLLQRTMSPRVTAEACPGRARGGERVRCASSRPPAGHPVAHEDPPR